MKARKPLAPAVACTGDWMPPVITTVTLLTDKPAIATRFVQYVLCDNPNSLLLDRYNDSSCPARKTPFSASHVTRNTAQNPLSPLFQKKLENNKN